MYKGVNGLGSDRAHVIFEFKPDKEFSFGLDFGLDLNFK